MAKRRQDNPRRHDHIRAAWAKAEAIGCDKPLEELRVPVKPKLTLPAVGMSPWLAAFLAMVGQGPKGQG